MGLQRGKSAFAQEPEVTGIRELSRADLTHLTTPRPANALQTLRDSHHRIARAVASGLPNYEVAAACGIGYSRLSILKADPAFAELVAHYRGMITAQWLTEADPVIELLGSVRTKALAMIEDKIDHAAEQNEFLPSRDLATFAELGLDRTGYGKVNKNVNINVDFAQKLEEARKRSAHARPSPPLAPTLEARPQMDQTNPASMRPNSSDPPSFRRL